MVVIVVCSAKQSFAYRRSTANVELRIAWGHDQFQHRRNVAIREAEFTLLHKYRSNQILKRKNLVPLRLGQQPALGHGNIMDRLAGFQRFLGDIG